jgi:hypothetical protein
VPLEYDHIVPIVGYDTATTPATLIYNDLYLSTTRTLAPSDAKSRSACYIAGDDYDLPETYCLAQDVLYAMAITGVVDPRKELVPISVAVDR